VAFDPISLEILWNRLVAITDEAAAPGLNGGRDGALEAVTLNGNPINPKETVIVQSGDLIVLNTPGGAGYGAAHERDACRVAADVAEGVVSAAQGSAQYGWRGM